MTEQAVEFHNPSTLAATNRYSHAVMVRGGKLIFVAGQVATDAKGELVGKGNYTEQSEQVFRNMERALESAGARLDDVIKLTYYIIDISHLPEVRDGRDRVVTFRHPPASTAVQVAALVNPEFLLEVDAIARVD